MQALRTAEDAAAMAPTEERKVKALGQIKACRADITMVLQALTESLTLTLKHCHSVTAAHVAGSRIGSQGLDPSRDVQVCTQHHCQRAAHPPFQAQPRCLSSTSSFRSAAVHTAPLMSPG